MFRRASAAFCRIVSTRARANNVGHRRPRKSRIVDELTWEYFPVTVWRPSHDNIHEIRPCEKPIIYLLYEIYAARRIYMSSVPDHQMITNRRTGRPSRSHLLTKPVHHCSPCVESGGPMPHFCEIPIHRPQCCSERRSSQWYVQAPKEATIPSQTYCRKDPHD